MKTDQVEEQLNNPIFSRQITGRGQICFGHSKTSQTGDLQSPSLPHTLRLQYR